MFCLLFSESSVWINVSSYYGRVQYELKVCSCRTASIPLVVQCVRFTDRRIHLPLEINTDRLFTNVIEWYGWSMLLHPLIHHPIQPRCIVVQWTCSVIHVNHTPWITHWLYTFQNVLLPLWQRKRCTLHWFILMCVQNESSFRRHFLLSFYTHASTKARTHACTHKPTHTHSFDNTVIQ